MSHRLDHLPLKRTSIEEAIQKISQIRPLSNTNDPITNEGVISSTISDATRYSFLDLPGEICNRIYCYTLAIGQKCVPCPAGLNKKRGSGFQLLVLCKQIHNEARSLLENKSTAYIPVTGMTPFGASINQVLAFGQRTVSPVLYTMIIALTTFMSVHIHMHCDATWTENGFVNVDKSSMGLIHRLRQALLIHTSNSADLVHASNGRNRYATVHLDQFIMFWRHRLPGAISNLPWNLWHCLEIMGRDTDTIWDVRYYVWTVDKDFNQRHPEWEENQWVQYREVKALCEQYDHVKLTVEVYGEQVWDKEGGLEREGSTMRETTRHSEHWSMTPYCRPGDPEQTRLEILYA
ncbi:hypothetical protein BCR34DRAFT_614092 [Clohesyomyces aquaticus]|uniref:Uncharacterized protein n=1 Tax=Clohesyomyces aquaticus TaxID=1231657 RepID=A0A1Y1ZPL3_9PLEO|nr:hypothetical protein BCR34DRAFT_614092 [Clohesyomyces aquaticus]